MISVIICSANQEELKNASENIRQTIGIPFEIIAIDNRPEKKGICEVYNQGVRQAKFDFVCFMHEDIEIKTTGWGMTVAEFFLNNVDIGILGVAGGGYKSLAPSGWYQLEFQSEEKSYQNVLQGYKYNNKAEILAYTNPLMEKLSRVVCVDGMWPCTRKSVAIQYPFDSQTFKGFHGYDIDFCLQVFPKYKVMVTFEILMKHNSEGNFNKDWLNEILKLHRKWNVVLPQTTSELSEKEIYFTEKRSFKKLVEQMLDWEYSFVEIQNMILACSKSEKMPLRLFFKAYLHLVKLKLGLLPRPGG